MARSKAVILAGPLVVAAAAALAMWPGAALAAVTERVSVSNTEVQANHESGSGSVSTDGRFVAFHSYATNLVTGDTNGRCDIFVRDRALGTTERVSVSSSEAQATDNCYTPSISADGRFVAFESAASNLVTGDTNGVADIFVRDRALGTTVRASRSTGGTQGNSNSYYSSISADGRYVSFTSLASNLVSGDTNGGQDIFVRDTQANATTRVSVSSLEAEGDHDSAGSSISADGRYVAFTSFATNLVPGDTNASNDIFVRDRTAGTTSRVSVTVAGTQAESASESPAISADGRYVAFRSYAENLVAGDTNDKPDIFVRDRGGLSTERMSVSSAEAQANDMSAGPAISANGRWIAFYSDATNLVAGDTNDAVDIFLRNRESGSTIRASVATAGTQADASSGSPAVSADGRVVAFSSVATNLVTGDTTDRPDVFAFVQDPYITYKSMRGTDRYDTALKISQAMFAGPLPADSGLVLAPGDTFQEALCGAPLASALGGPVLITPRTSLRADVAAEIDRLDPDRVILINLSTSILSAVADVLEPGADAELLEGSDVYDMSYRVALALDSVVGGLDAATAIITRGTLYPDAIGVSPLACRKKWPILLTTNATGALSAKAVQALSELDIPRALKVGTYVTLPAGVDGVGNLSGDDRYITNSNVAQWSKDNASLLFIHTGIATGENFPDALAAGPYLAKDSGILLLTPLYGPLPPSVAAKITANRTSVAQLSYIAMIEPVISLVKALLP